MEQRVKGGLVCRRHVPRANHVKDAQWAVVPAAGHAIAWEKPEVFNANLLRFLKGDESFARVKEVSRP